MRCAIVVLLLALSLSPSVSADCEVTGVATIDRLRVRIPGQRLRTLSVVDLPVAVRPGRGNRYRDVRVLAPLSFGARTDAAIPWAVARAGPLADGVVHMTTRAALESVRERVDSELDQLVVRARVDENVWIDRIHTRCEAITVGAGEGSPAAPEWASMVGPRWDPVVPRIWLTAQPGDGASVRLEAPEGLPSPLIELERRNDYVRVGTVFSTGAAIRGWVRRTDLRAVVNPEREAEPWTRPLVVSAQGTCRRRPPRRNEYVGPARLSQGAIVTTQTENGQAWATVSEPSVVTISWRTGSQWVRIVHVPGVLGDTGCPDVLQVAYVPRRAVTLTGGIQSTVGATSTELLLGLE